MAVTDDNRSLATDEARRASQRDSMKVRVDKDVNAAIAQRAEHTSTPEAERLGKVAVELRTKAIDEVVGKEREVARARRLARTSQFINYAFGVVYTLLAVRLALGLLGARSGAGFVQLINTLTNPFCSMFRGIVASPTSEGGQVLALPMVIAIAAYGLLHLGVLGMLRLLAHRKTQI